MVRKNKLVNFIRRYNIKNINEDDSAVAITSKDKTLSTKFRNKGKTVQGQINEYTFNIADGVFSVYDPDQLLRMLHVLSDDIDIDPIGKNDQFDKLILSDGKIKANFLLCDPSVIDMPELRMPDDGLTFQLTSEFCNRFIKAYSALIDYEFCTIEPVGQDDVKVIIGTPDDKSMNLTITTPVDTLDDFLMGGVIFRASVIKDIIVANKGFEKGTMQVSEQGIAKITFYKSGDFSSQYYVVAEQQDD